ncbi:MAG TPA: NIPSNAP family protein [Symbiobacteriaceae bacterium]|jgi:hypothetical protein
MIYEWREYYIAPGKQAALHKRFQEHSLKLFAKHGITVMGFWDVFIGEAPKLVYLCQYPDLGVRERAWNGFYSDPEWIAAKAESEKDGVLTTKVVNSILKPTEFSAMK